MKKGFIFREKPDAKATVVEETAVKAQELVIQADNLLKKEAEELKREEMTVKRRIAGKGKAPVRTKTRQKALAQEKIRTQKKNRSRVTVNAGRSVESKENEQVAQGRLLNVHPEEPVIAVVSPVEIRSVEEIEVHNIRKTQDKEQSADKENNNVKIKDPGKTEQTEQTEKRKGSGGAKEVQRGEEMKIQQKEQKQVKAAKNVEKEAVDRLKEDSAETVSAGDDGIYLISDAAKQVEVESHVLRYWEEELKLPIHRNEQGHRYYTREDVEQFKEIKALKEKGFQLKAIKMMITDSNMDVIVPISDNREEKSYRLQLLLRNMISDVVRETNQEFGNDIKDSILKELDYQFRLKEEQDTEREQVRLHKDEEHYKKLDELLRQYQDKKMGKERRKRRFIF